MRTFEQVLAEVDLKRWLRPPLGQFHLPRSKTGDRLLYRHFDTDDIADLVRPYAEVVEAVERWIADRPDVAELVETQPLTEIGHDYVARPFYSYMYTLEGYDDPEEWDLVDVIPEELEPMRQRVRNHLVDNLAGRERIVQQIVIDSLLGPSRTTVFGHDKWLIVSPQTTADQLQHWASLATDDE